MACCYEPKTKFKIKGLRSSRSESDREGPELRVVWLGFAWGIRVVRWCWSGWRGGKAHDENGVVVATELNDKPPCRRFLLHCESASLSTSAQAEA